MGEAKNRISVPDDVKKDIARIVRSVNISSVGGTCFLRQAVSVHVFQTLRLPFRLAWGGMIYRAGPDPLWDVLAFCNHGNSAARHPDTFLGHAWIESGNDIVDFTVGDWKEQNEGAIQLGAAHGCDDASKPINWTAPALPTFLWTHSRPLKSAWKREGTPALGVMWYESRQWDVWDNKFLSQRVIDFMNLVSPALRIVTQHIKRFEIIERIYRK